MVNQFQMFQSTQDLSNIFCPEMHSEEKKNTFIHKNYKKGEFIYWPKENADKVFYLVKGAVKIGTYDDNGKELIKAIHSKGELFGESALIGTPKRINFARATEATEVCLISVEDMHSLMGKHSGLNLYLIKTLGSRMIEMEQRLESLVFKKSEARIKEFLYKLALKKGQRIGYEMLVRKFMYHQEIASLTDTSRQTVNATLNELRNKNILTFNRKRLLIRDMNLLAEAVKE